MHNRYFKEATRAALKRKKDKKSSNKCTTLWSELIGYFVHVNRSSKLFFLVEYPNSGHSKPTAEGTINHLLRSKIVLHLYQYFYRPALRGSVIFGVFCSIKRL